MPDRRLGWLVFSFFLAVYLLTSGGHFYSADGGNEYEVTRAIVTRQAIDTPGLGLPGRDGKFYPQHGIGQSIAWIPFYVVGTVLQKAGFGGAAHGLAASGLNAIATAATAAMLFLLALRLGARRRAALAVALAYGFATMAWVYSKNTFDVVLTGALVTAAVLLLERIDDGDERSRTLVVAGAALGWAAVTRVPTLVLWIPAAIFVWAMRPDKRLRRAVLFATPLAVSLGIVLLHNYLRYGSILDDGHTADSATRLNGGLIRGIGGLLVSPARGLVFFAPVVIVSILGWVLLRRSRPRIAFLIAGFFLLTLLEYAKVAGWQGGFSWGPRFLLPVVPIAVLPAVFVFDRWSALTRGRRAAVLGAVVIGVLLTLPGVLADYQLQTLLRERSGHTVTEVWNFSNAPYIYHTRTLPHIVADDAPFPAEKAESGRLHKNTWDFWWWYAIVQRTARGLVVLAVLALVAIAAFTGVRVWRATAEPNT